MTKIVRASLGLPTLRAGPQFQNFKLVLVIEYWNLKFVCDLVLGVWDFISSPYSTCRLEKEWTMPTGHSQFRYRRIVSAQTSAPLQGRAGVTRGSFSSAWMAACQRPA